MRCPVPPLEYTVCGPPALRIFPRVADSTSGGFAQKVGACDPLTRAITYLTHQSGEGHLKLDESCISNPKSEVSNWTSRAGESNLRFRISDLRCRIRPISNCYRSGLQEPSSILMPFQRRD